ncbi:MAG: MtnX-like HAD-IB family phosphatase [Chloroflexi bacterium]|nr:MtnX-like HAD-IB family phosphatase [Chloroflexota bacterium]
MSTLVQCDFDGTILTENLGDNLLQAYAGEVWKRFSAEYKAGNIRLEDYNRGAFSQVREGKEELLRYISGHAVMRRHFPELVEHCRENGLEFVIVSNGLDFYIQACLENFGLKGVPFHSGQADFTPSGIRVTYPYPDSMDEAQTGFKAAYAELFRKRGHRIIYLGDGLSDRAPASRAHYTFARGSLLEHCRSNGLPHSPFEDFREVVEVLKKMND